MNATFVLTGVLILVGLLLTRSIWPRHRLTTWGLIFLGVAGVGTILDCRPALRTIDVRAMSNSKDIYPASFLINFVDQSIRSATRTEAAVELPG
jgi:hypothetical protein